MDVGALRNSTTAEMADAIDQLVPVTKLATADTDRAMAGDAPGLSVAQLALREVRERLLA